MLEKVGRNDSCPCGSGMKYKKCCLLKEEENNARRRAESLAVQNAFDWLVQHYPQQVADAAGNEFFGGIEKTDLDNLNKIFPHLQVRMQFNLRDWLINDTYFEMNGEEISVRELLLGTNGLQMAPADLACLKAIGELPLSLYEVRSVKPGEGVELADILHPNTEPVWIIERIASRSSAQLDIFGARLLKRDNGLVMSGAVYPLTREDALVCRDEILCEMEGASWGTGLARKIVSSHIKRHWLSGLVDNARLLSQVGAA